MCAIGHLHPIAKRIANGPFMRRMYYALQCNSLYGLICVKSSHYPSTLWILKRSVTNFPSLAKSRTPMNIGIILSNVWYFVLLAPIKLLSWIYLLRQCELQFFWFGFANSFCILRALKPCGWNEINHCAPSLVRATNFHSSRDLIRALQQTRALLLYEIDFGVFSRRPKLHSANFSVRVELDSRPFVISAHYDVDRMQKPASEILNDILILSSLFASGRDLLTVDN